MGFDEHNGALYPFTLAQKLARITEPCSWYDADGDSPWGRPIVPTEMMSVLADKAGIHLPVRGPAVGLFIDLEVRYLDGPCLRGSAIPGRAHDRGSRAEQAGGVVLDRIDAHRRGHRRPHGARCCCTRAFSRPPTPAIRPPDPIHIRAMSHERYRCAHLSSLVFFGVDDADLGADVVEHLHRGDGGGERDHVALEMAVADACHGAWAAS